MTTRKIKKIVTGSNQIDGAGVHLVRVLGRDDVKDFDPFLMLDAFDSKNPDDYIKGFPLHPHRGIETFTYLIKGKIEHQDNLGNSGVINDGDSQWMTAGSGIMHQEMPKPSGHMLGLQLWINLPKENKMVNPHYFDVSANMVKAVTEENATVKVVAGSYKDSVGAQGKYVAINFLDIQVKPGQTFQLLTDKDSTVFVYIVEGSGCFGDNAVKEVAHHSAVLLDYAEEFLVKAGHEGIRFVLFSGRPLKEPVAWGGPIVMNTRDELYEAFHELEEGTFIKAKK